MGSAAQAWAAPEQIAFFSRKRATLADLYPSERVFLDPLLVEGVSVLDVGCAQGGLASAIAEKVERFSYTGVDTCPAMIEAAAARRPGHRFVTVDSGDFSPLAGERFDLVVALGFLHLDPLWRDSLRVAWERCAGALVFDLREHARSTVVGYCRIGEGAAVPYHVLNRSSAAAIVADCCRGASHLAFHGYRHALDRGAPVAEALCTVWCAQR